MNTARSRVAHLQYSIQSNVLLNVEVPLHVIAAWRIRLNIRVTKCRRGQWGKCSVWKRPLRQRRVVTQLKKRSRQQHRRPEQIWEREVIEYSETNANGCLTFTKRIPRKTYSRFKIEL